MRLPVLTPRAYQRVAEVALAALTLIVATGAAVRLTGSGLGCPDWPKCYGGVAPPLETHAWIEYGNRLISGAVGLAAVAAGALAFRRRPFRRDLAVLGVLLPLGVVSQAVLGGFTVRDHLAPGFVMAHFALSMLILVAAVALAWRARYEPGERPRSLDRARRLVGARAAAARRADDLLRHRRHGRRPARGRRRHRRRHRPARVEGQRHGRAGRSTSTARSPRVLGLSVVGVFFLLRHRGAPEDVWRPVGVVAVLLAIQGMVGAIQYALGVPSEIVWIHVVMAALTWLALLWSVAAAGRPAPASALLPAASEEAAEPPAAHVGAVLGGTRRVVR